MSRSFMVLFASWIAFRADTNSLLLPEEMSVPLSSAGRLPAGQIDQLHTNWEVHLDRSWHAVCMDACCNISTYQ